MVSTIIGFTKALFQWLRPGLIAIFGRNIPFNIRWRLLLLQPIHFLGCIISGAPYLLSRPYSTEWITVSPGVTLRTLIHKAKSKSAHGEKLRPLHLSIHGGAFLGGLPEMDTPFCWKLAEETGAVVVSATYRYAPEYPFPAAIDDIDAMVRYLQEHAEEKYGADPKLMTVGGFSAGGNLALAAAQQENCHGSAPVAFKAALIYYGAVCFAPSEKNVDKR
jgi:acetyl esterase/lipase